MKLGVIINPSAGDIHATYRDKVWHCLHARYGVLFGAFAPVKQKVVACATY